MEAKEKQNKQFPARPARDVLKFLLEHAPLATWEQDVLAMLREEGFAHVEVVHREPLAYRLARAGYRRLRGPHFRAQQGRVVVHAHRA